jgi:thioredoxin 1
MIEINESNFSAETGTGLVLVDFYADWCPPCRMLIPVLEKVTGAKVVKVNVDSCQELASRYNISAIPKLLFMKDGEVVDEISGFVNESVLQSKINVLNDFTEF